MRAETEQVAGELALSVEAWVEARMALTSAFELRDTAIRREARRVHDTTGGIGVRRFEADRRRRSVATAGEALRHARALRCAPAVHAAITEQRRILEEADRAVDVARSTVATAAAALLAYGPIGAKAAGVTPSELARVAEGPAREEAHASQKF